MAILALKLSEVKIRTEERPTICPYCCGRYSNVGESKEAGERYPLADTAALPKLREIDLFAEILFMDGETPAHPWLRRYMLGRAAKIEQNLPFIEFDWGSLGKYL